MTARKDVFEHPAMLRRQNGSNARRKRVASRALSAKKVEVRQWRSEVIELTMTPRVAHHLQRDLNRAHAVFQEVMH